MEFLGFTDLGIGTILALQTLFLSYLWKHERRINRIENDLYVSDDNPASLPLTKQIASLSKDIREIREKIIYIERMLNNKGVR